MTDTGQDRGASADADRELWRARDDHYADRVFVAEGGGIGMHAAFGRAIVKTVGEWHHLATEVERLSAGYASFPKDVAAVLSEMGDGEYCSSAKDAARDLGLTEKRVREIRRALKALGFAHYGPLCDVDSEAYAPRGSGYWASPAGERFAAALHASRMEARQGGDREDGRHAKHDSPTGEAGDAQTQSHNNEGGK